MAVYTVYTYTHICVYMYSYMYTYTYTYLYMYMGLYTYVYVDMYTYACGHRHIHTYAYVSIEQTQIQRHEKLNYNAEHRPSPLMGGRASLEAPAGKHVQGKQNLNKNWKYCEAIKNSIVAQAMF